MGELESIRVFLTVAELESFAGAARRLGMTPASVTRTVAALEDKLDLQLLVRTTRQVSLTSAGALYAARVAPLAEGLAQAVTETREAQGMTTGRIRISAPLSLGLEVLPTVLSQFATLHPQTHVAVHLSDSFVDIVEEDFDLAIRVSGPPSDTSTIWRKICKVPRVLVASAEYIGANGQPKSPEELTEFSCLSYQSDAREEVWELSKNAVQVKHKVTGALSANNGDLLAQLALNGEGITLLPRFIVARDLEAGRLVQVLPEWEISEIWLTLYYPPYNQLPLRVAAFSDIFEQHVQTVCSL